MAKRAPEPLLMSLPYGQRKFITVNDQVRQLSPKKMTGSRLSRFTKALGKVAGVAGLASMGNTSAAVVGALGLGAGAVAVAPVLIWGAAGVAAVTFFYPNGKESTSILAVPTKQLTGIEFPMGHPMDKTVYVGHPGVPSRYYRACDFHRELFVHKLSEVYNLLVALGAQEIHVEHVSGWSKEFAAQISAGMTGASLAFDVGKKAASRSLGILIGNLKGHSSPRLPSDLVWFKHEETWQAIARARMAGQLRNFELNLVYVDDHGVNSSFKAIVEKAGLSIGGNFQTHQSTFWKLRGTFPDS